MLKVEETMRKRRLQRLAAYHILVALQSSLRRGLDVGFCDFAIPAGWHLAPLSPHQTRFRDPHTGKVMVFDASSGALHKDSVHADTTHHPQPQFVMLSGSAPWVALCGFVDATSNVLLPSFRFLAACRVGVRVCLHRQECGDISGLPLLSSCQDQGATGYAALQYLAGPARRLVAIFPDAFHREWNSTKAACSKSQHGFWSTIVQLTIVYNLNKAPWSSAAFWRVKQDLRNFRFWSVFAKREYFAMLAPHLMLMCVYALCYGAWAYMRVALRERWCACVVMCMFGRVNVC
jgi:hypothetical protein